MKIIFLDIDGVIHLDNNWCQESIEILNKLVLLTSSKIVITSDWRYNYSLQELKNIFNHFNINVEIIDSIGFEGELKLETIEKDRADGINKYIVLNNLNDYLVLDDYNLENNGIYCEKFVKTRFNIGLKENGLFEKCVKILNRNNKTSA